MALSEIKTNTPKRETKDEPQTNGSYKIRQIIMKIIEIHIYIYTHKQNQNSPTKVQQIDPASKGNQKLYLPVKNKTKAQTGKQK